MIKTYYLLTKPGIIVGNLITTASGFLLASRGHFDLKLFIFTMLGLSLVIASACIFNNYIDREADKKMARTKNRAFAQGIVSPPIGMIFAIFLGAVGTLILAIYTNPLSVGFATLGFFFYVVMYSFSKYLTTYATAIGSIAGALPPVVGYCAVNPHFDLGALLLFSIIVLWQMPHFFSIAVYRLDDYIAASIPVLPAKKGIHLTKIRMVVYIIAFMIAAALLTLLGYTGYTYLIVAALLGLGWLLLCIKGFSCKNDKVWARQMFTFSIMLIMVLSIMISVNAA